MATYLDFLVVLDDHLRASAAGEVTFAHDMHKIARDAGLSTGPQSQAAYWTGQLVDRGYVVHSPPPINGRPAPPPRAGWTEEDFGRFSRFELTDAGLTAAERERQTRRAQATDMTLSPAGLLSAAWLADDWRESVRRQVDALRSALDREDWTAAVGNAKNLVEAAALVVLERAGQEPPSRQAALPQLVGAASDTLPHVQSELAKRLASAVQVIAEVRNASDVGHGKAAPAEVPAADARLAASGAVAISTFLLSGE